MKYYFIIFYLIFINCLTFYAYKYDKTNAELNGPSKELLHPRVPEKILHLLSLIGGWPLAFASQQYLRHKTIKQPFQQIFKIIVFINIFIFFLISFNESFI